MSKSKNLLPPLVLAALLAAAAPPATVAPPAFTCSDYGTIQGVVVDRDTGEPLQAVNVFLANSQIGAATDRNGRFILHRVPFGVYDLVVSMIGYDIVTRRVDVHDAIGPELRFDLVPRPLQAPEITVTARDMKAWRQQLARFTELLFSTTPNADSCRILNPEMLDFAGERRTFTATAQEPLLIENRALGYRLYYVLDRFEYSGDYLVYAGYPRFEALVPASAAEAARWQENRRRAYHGSLRHFLATLVEQYRQTGGHTGPRPADTRDDVLSKSGYYVLQVREAAKEGKRAGRGLLVNTNNLLAPDAHGHTWTLRFDAADELQVAYTAEKEDIEYLFLRREPDRTPSDQLSWLRLTDGAMQFQQNGQPVDYTQYQVHGYWAWERLADLLPLDYHPAPTTLPDSDVPAGAVVALPPVDGRRLYDEYARLRAAGDWEAALDTLAAAHSVRDRIEPFDPRLGIAYIELAAARQAVAHYENACRLYLRSLSPAGWRQNRLALLDEAARLLPLLDEQRAAAWRRMIKDQDSELLRELQTFWLERDPAPSSPYNERIVEHWRRIAHARQQFTKASKAPYGTDDRGIIYVKYGAPARTKSLTLHGNMPEMQRWYDEYKPFEFFPEFSSRLERYLLYPTCDVWVYTTLHSQERVLFIFGDAADGGYRLVNGIEELIPANSFRRTALDWTRLPAGSLLQLAYYSQLMVFDPYFEDRYRELEITWTESKRSGSLFTKTASIEKRMRLEDADNPLRRYAPPAQSAFDALQQRIELSSAGVRLLDNRNQPRFLVAGFAVPQGLGAAAGATAARPAYDLRFTLILRDASLRETARLAGETIPGLPNAAVFAIADTFAVTHVALAAEAVAVEQAAIVGARQAVFAKAPPLNPDPARLEASDVVLGILPPDEGAFSRFPLPILPARTIWRGDPLQLYFEVYHLQPDKDGRHRFSADLRVTHLEVKNDRLRRKEMVASRFDFETETGTAKEQLGVDVAKLRRGEYELSLTLTDRQSRQQVERHARFTIRE